MGACRYILAIDTVQIAQPVEMIVQWQVRSLRVIFHDWYQTRLDDR